MKGIKSLEINCQRRHVSVFCRPDGLNKGKVFFLTHCSSLFLLRWLFWFCLQNVKSVDVLRANDCDLHIRWLRQSVKWFGRRCVFQSRSLCSSPLPEPSPSLTSSSSSSPSEWGPQPRDNDWGSKNRAASPARAGQASPLPYQHQDHQQRPRTSQGLAWCVLQWAVGQQETDLRV